MRNHLRHRPVRIAEIAAREALRRLHLRRSQLHLQFDGEATFALVALMHFHAARLGAPWDPVTTEDATSPSLMTSVETRPAWSSPGSPNRSESAATRAAREAQRDEEPRQPAPSSAHHPVRHVDQRDSGQRLKWEQRSA